MYLPCHLVNQKEQAQQAAPVNAAGKHSPNWRMLDKLQSSPGGSCFVMLMLMTTQHRLIASTAASNHMSSTNVNAIFPPIKVMHA